MTFDEAENLLLEQNLDDEVASLVAYEMSVLKDTYAPTVRMTQEQYQQFIDFRKRTDSVQTHAVTLHDKKTKYPEFLNDLVGGVYGRLFLQAWLHPETIKVVDE
ncbi:hypothetical protein [Leuconostoc mesenteroides]|uniref:hypothetical protein n=1 Tax=Leuconostoc mesenteroides TaxID=1245 RepID=UPI0021A76C35|nr:hypothetical protein [Leuconostoc mesenteroides]MCT3053910.1 hypothetical protein [Leuconostoc mesenteroides]